MAPHYDVLAIGRSSIDLYAHQIGVPITEVTSFDAYVGGCPTNISVGTRRLGLNSALLTAVGDDQVGDFVVSFLEREGIETRFIPRKPKHRTSAVILTIQPPDRFPLTYYREGCADRELTCDDVIAAPVEDSAIVVVSGTGLTHEPARAATLFAAATAPELRAPGLPRPRLSTPISGPAVPITPHGPIAGGPIVDRASARRKRSWRRPTIRICRRRSALLLGLAAPDADRQARCRGASIFVRRRRAGTFARFRSGPERARCR